VIIGLTFRAPSSEANAKLILLLVGFVSDLRQLSAEGADVLKRLARQVRSVCQGPHGIVLGEIATKVRAHPMGR
jgi:hypothetical protein